MKSFTNRLKYLLFVIGLAVSLQAEAHSASHGLAQAEFLFLKKVGNWQNHAAGGNYVEVFDTGFIGLQAATSASRTCLFGFTQDTESQGLTDYATRFVCFPTKLFQVHLKKQWCVVGSLGCEMDPAGISIGIGNLDVIEPEAVPDSGILGGNGLDAFPSTVTIEYHASEYIPEQVPGTLLDPMLVPETIVSPF